MAAAIERVLQAKVQRAIFSLFYPWPPWLARRLWYEPCPHPQPGAPADPCSASRSPGLFKQPHNTPTAHKTTACVLALGVRELVLQVVYYQGYHGRGRAAQAISPPRPATRPRDRSRDGAGQPGVGLTLPLRVCSYCCFCVCVMITSCSRRLQAQSRSSNTATCTVPRNETWSKRQRVGAV